MKAFDTITPAHYQKQKSLHQTSKRQYFVINKKQSIQIPIKTKVEIKAISHEVRKPKVHIIKTKQPHVHILESRGKDVLGFDTESEEWGHHGHGSSMPVQQQSNIGGGLFNAIRNSSLFHRQNNQIQQQQSMQSSRNPFEILRQKFTRQPQPQIIEQPLPMNTLGFGLQNHMNAMEQQRQKQHQENAQKAVNILLPLSQPDIEQNQIQRQVEIIDRQNLQQSHVQRVQLQNIPAAFPQQQQRLQQSLGDRLLNFFKSFRNKNTQQQQLQQHNNQHSNQLAQNIGFRQNNQHYPQPNHMAMQKSQVQQYQQPYEPNKKSQHKVKFQQSLVQEYHVGH